ncbi:MAG: prepilin-type N-terminal cleavage/methylation domain-containing protein [Pirellulales bacterium]|nr:prepilin-type N-terminal cleavage/methylation domain-containing protein [Pirellulales bacterium]
MRHRKGFSLIECVVAFSLIATTFAMVMAAMHGMARLNQRVREDLEKELALGRFAAQFRCDAHEALSCELEDTGKKPAAGVLRLTLSGERSVRYALGPRRIERVVRSGDRIQRRERYSLPASYVPAWKVDRERPLARASLVMEPETAGVQSPLRFEPLRVDAAVGLLRAASRSSKP